MSRSPSPAPATRRRASRSPSNEPDTKRTRTQLSPSPPPSTRDETRRRSPDRPRLYDVDPERRRERERQQELERQVMRDNDLAAQPTVKKVDLKEEMKKMASTKGGGAYIPPHRLRAMLEDQETQDPAGQEYQRLTWEALRKSLNGLINKVNVSNIKLIVPELFGENLIRGRGLFVRSVMRAQASSLSFTPVFASLVAIINTKLPQVGELLLHRLVHQFRRSYKRNDKPTMTATTTFIAQLVNQQVAHELLALQILVLLLERPTDDSVEIAVSFMREVGAFLAENSPKANIGVFDRFRSILNESGIDKRVQYMVEVLFQVRKDKFKDHPIIPEGLDLVEEEDAITHKLSLDDEVQVQEMLNVFKFDPDYLENEVKYKEIKQEILGDSEDEEEESGSEGDTEEDSEDDVDDGIKADGTVDVHDQTGANVVNLRRTIYLTIMSALDFEEAVHKLLKINLAPGQENEMCNMIIECCSQERTFSKFYGLMGERFCKLNQVWASCFEQCFVQYYDTIHRYETNRLRNIARFFGHLLMTDAISWTVLETIKMNEDDTTSSSRIFVKIMFQETTEGMGLTKLKERLADESLQVFLHNIFPKDNPKNTRFSINFFTSIGLGAVTEDMREHLKRAPQIMMEQRRQLAADSSDSDSSTESSLSSSSLSSSSGYSSRSRSRSPPRRRRYSSDDSRRRSVSPPPRRRRSLSDSRSPPPARRRRSYSRSDSGSPPPSRSRRYSDSRSPPPRRRRYSDSRSPPPATASRRRADSRSVSPPARRGGGGGGRSPSPEARRRRYDSRSPSPPPAKGSRLDNADNNRRNDARRRSPSPPATRRRSPSPDRGPAEASGNGGGGGGGGVAGKAFIHPDRLAAVARAEGGGRGGGRGGYNGGGGRGGGGYAGRNGMDRPQDNGYGSRAPR
ncbi:pre-mRNA-splicing factor cwc22 [Microbotryomycetes sp. NB124-2]